MRSLVAVLAAALRERRFQHRPAEHPAHGQREFFRRPQLQLADLLPPPGSHRLAEGLQIKTRKIRFHLWFLLSVGTRRCPGTGGDDSQIFLLNSYPPPIAALVLELELELGPHSRAQARPHPRHV